MSNSMVSEIRRSNHRFCIDHPVGGGSPAAPAPKIFHAPVQPVAISDLTLLQQVAMLQMIHTTLTAGIIKRITRINDCQDKPSLADYRALSDHGFCEKQDDDRYHYLTPQGREFGKFLIAKICQEQNIHVMQDTRYETFTVYRCSCGMWSTQLNGGGRHQWSRASNSWRKHVPPAAFEAEAV